MTQTVPDISPLMPMHQDPLLVCCCLGNILTMHVIDRGCFHFVSCMFGLPFFCESGIPTDQFYTYTKTRTKWLSVFMIHFPRISVHTCIEEHCKFQIKIYSTLWIIIRPFSSTRYKWKCMCFLTTVCTYFGETGLISGRYKTCFYWLYQIHWTNQSMFSYRAWKGAPQNMLTRCCWHSAQWATGVRDQRA